MYNESALVVSSAKRLTQALDALIGKEIDDYEIIFSDDGSTDNSLAILSEYASENARIKIIKSLENRGKGSAVRLAVGESRGDIVMYTDCDLAYGVDVIRRALSFFDKEKADIVVGSRNLSKDGYESYGVFRRIASKTYIKILSSLGGLKLTDSQCGFKAFDGDSARKIFSLCGCDGFAFDYEALLIAEALGMKTVEMPLKILTHKESKVHLLKDSICMFAQFLKIKKRIEKIF